MEAIKLHPIYSETILSRVAAFADTAEIAGAHHERLDGMGYPRGLTADNIPLDTRVLTVADVFEALTADRPYRLAMTHPEALALMARDLGTAFDPECFEALQRVVGAVEPASERELLARAS